MKVKKYTVLLIAILATAGCVKKEDQVDIPVGEDYEDKKTDEYKFYDLKAKKSDEIASSELPSLASMPLWEHVEFIKKLEKHVKHKIKTTKSLKSDWATLTYEVEASTDVEKSKPDAYVDFFAKEAVNYAQTISELYPNNHYKILKFSLELPDGSKIISKLQISKLIEDTKKETYLIMDSVLETEKTKADSLADKAVHDSCSNILSKEMNPFFCSTMKKIIILDSEVKANQDIMNNAKKTKSKEYRYGFDVKESKTQEKIVDSIEKTNGIKEKGNTDSVEEMINNIEDQEHPPLVEPEHKSSLSKEEIKALEEAGFEVKLN